MRDTSNAVYPNSVQLYMVHSKTFFDPLCDP